MFTGIIETIGEIISIEKNSANLDFIIRSKISDQLKVDQSVSHNGVCMTVINVTKDTHTVSAVNETLQRSNFGKLKIKDKLNLERSMSMNGRLDGHIVQGHVDHTAVCKNIENHSGSHLITFEFNSEYKNLLVEKGSVCVNGVSLTVVTSDKSFFSVAIIPYTFEHTTFKFLKAGDLVNIEFDIIGKYVSKILENKSVF